MLGWWRRKVRLAKSLGQAGEDLAKQKYQAMGFTILASNFFNRRGLRLGEVDFIARDRGLLVFVEVKTRSAASAKFGSGAEAVHPAKQQRLLKAAKVFLLKHPELGALQPRIDVCLVTAASFDKTLGSVTIIPNAVEDWS